MISKTRSPPTIAEVWFSCALAQPVLRRRILFYIERKSQPQQSTCKKRQPAWIQMLLVGNYGCQRSAQPKYGYSQLVCPVVMFIKRRKLQLKMKLISGTTCVPTEEPQRSAADVPSFRPYFGYALLYAVVLENSSNRKSRKLYCSNLNDHVGIKVLKFGFDVRRAS